MKTHAKPFSLLLALAASWSLCSIAFAAAPANDNFAAATTLTGDTGTITGTTVGATDEVSEALSFGQASIWYNWTPSVTGRATIDTFGSAFDTELSAWTGLDVPTLNLCAANDDWSSAQSQIQFDVTAGTVYHLRLAGYKGSTGDTVLSWIAQVPPANDHFANAAVLTGASGTVNGDTTAASIENGEIFSDQLSVWYSWTAPFTGTVQFDTIGSAADTTLAMGTGSSVSTFSPVAQNDDNSVTMDGTSRVRVAVMTGSTYIVRVGSHAEGKFTLNWSQIVYTPNVIAFSAATYTVSESGGSATITLQRTIGTENIPVRVSIYSRDGSATVTADYWGVYIQLGFAADELTRTVDIPIIPDRAFEGEESVFLTLIEPDEAVNLGTSAATLLIADDDPFIPLKAGYAGLIADPVFDYSLTGCLNVAAAGNGAYTGVLKLGPDTFRFKGSFDANGRSTPTISAGLTLTVVYADDGDTIRGTLTKGALTRMIESARSPYGQGAYYPNGAAPGFIPPTFTIRLPGSLGDPGDTPKGDGYLTASIDKFGTAKICGALADGTAFSAAGPLSHESTLPIYLQLYKKTGSFSSLLVLQPRGSSAAAATHWYKPAAPMAKAFKDLINRDLAPSVNDYLNDPSRRILPSLDFTRGVADFFARKGGLPADLTQVFNLTDANKVALPLMPAVKLTLKFTPKSGLFSGTFQPSAGVKTNFKGAVFQDDAFASGYFLRTTAGQTAGGLVKFAPVQ